jgi:hypothetical protein
VTLLLAAVSHLWSYQFSQKEPVMQKYFKWCSLESQACFRRDLSPEGFENGKKARISSSKIGRIEAVSFDNKNGLSFH